MEATNSRRARVASRSGQLRGVPAVVRWLLGRGSGVPSAASARRRRPVLPTGRRHRCSRRLRKRQHAAEAAAISVSGH